MLLRRDFTLRCKHWERNWTYDWNLSLMAHIDGEGIAKVTEALVFHRDHEAEFSNKKGFERSTPSAWKPYLCGWKDYRRIQKTERWKSFYQYLLAQEKLKQHPLAFILVNLLLSRKTTSLLRLCFLCMMHKDKIYHGNATGLIGCLRGFFFPSIYAYFNKGEFV